MASENLQIVAFQSSRGQRILSLKGPLSMRTLFEFQQSVRSESSPVLIVDFSDVPFIDSAGLGALVAAHVNARKSDCRILFAALNRQARTLIEMTHVNDLLPTYDTIQDAEAAVVALDHLISEPEIP
jgi:anti-anti-sigma factor